MHLQQTKRGSRKSGGPQYYFHDLTEAISTYLRKKGAVPVALVTPYGATKSHFFAVGKDHKLDGTKVLSGKVRHDRIQQAGATQSIGEAIRDWYNLKAGDFERIDVEVQIIDDIFYVTPTVCRFATAKRSLNLPAVDKALTFTTRFKSTLWQTHLESLAQDEEVDLAWVHKEITRVVQDHRRDMKGMKVAHLKEPDLLRTAGALDRLGISLGGYVGTGYDCVTHVQFLSYPSYRVPVELKRHSHGFTYQQKRYAREELSRAIVLCAFHDHPRLPSANIDVIELAALSTHLESRV
ncbi:MAG: hypothetical protein ACT4P4_00880 [Betaproteobacteria bacterium]